MSGVYLSYPFCGQKCTFCNFASGVQPASLEIRYNQTLAEELSAHRWDWTPDTVYLGGGTPGNLDPVVLGGLLARIPGRDWVEATIESAPGGLTLERVQAWQTAGINRISFGVQSFADRELRYSGRRHSAATVRAEVDLIRAAGLPNFNIDLIAGMPYQTGVSWGESLDWIERLAPPHVSVYMLEVDDDSRLGREMLLGGVRYGAAEAPSADQTAEFYEIAVERLAKAGLARYEISNFALPGFESLHNLKYWRLEPYEGFGSDAHSFNGRVRRANAETAAGYVEQWTRERTACVETTDARPEEERFFVGLRLMEGVRLNDGEWPGLRVRLARHLTGGLLEFDGTHLRLTARGVLLSNEVFQEFLGE